MKKRIIIFAILTFNLLLSTFNCYAQPNPGFESWSPEFSYENPNGWQTLNFLSILSPPNPLSAFKAIGAETHSGFYALKLKTVFISNNPNTTLIPDTASIAFSGKINLSPFSYNYGFPYTGRPEKLEFWAKYAPVGSDSAGAGVVLLKSNGTSRDTIAMGGVNIGTTLGYTLFQVSLNYNSTAIPDSATIVFTSSRDRVFSRVGSTLFVDDLSFTGWVGIDEKNSYGNKVKVFPNPAKGDINIHVQMEEAENVRIVDSSGKLAGVHKIQSNNVNINTALFADGTYFYEVLDKKNRALITGKFNVIK